VSPSAEYAEGVRAWAGELRSGSSRTWSEFLAEPTDAAAIDAQVPLPAAAQLELVRRLASALAVVYAPIEEDYGLVTIQAFLAGVPVITAADSGGVLEWVEHEVTGLVTDGTPGGIAAAIDRLAGDRALARKLGAAGHARAATLGWGPVVERLTS